MGSKGSQNTQTSQTQTYAPAGAGYVSNALDRATSAANQPMNIPQAPVAGFSQDQQRAFGNINAAQGQAQPYYSQAASYFSPQGAQQFFNPYADNVMAGLKDIFGEQNSQNLGNLRSQAGGTGADRIAVGQANLAKQQGLTAGQTLSGLYQNAAQQAQAAGQGQMQLGQAAQGSALQGANAQLTAGGLQQQLQQQQLNSPYQQQLAQMAAPYQQAQFLAGITGALAPGLGGTTSGTGSQSSEYNPSLWGQIGGGLGAIGSLGYFGNGNKGGSPSTGATYGGYGSGSNGWGSMGGVQYPAYAQGGRLRNPYEMADGGGVPNDPINIAPENIFGPGSIIPMARTPQIQEHRPNLNLTPAPQKQSGSGSGGKGGGIGDIAKMAMMFINRGGRVNNPYEMADGGGVDDRFDAVQDAIASGDFDPQGMNSTTFGASPEMAAAREMAQGPVPLPTARPASANPVMASAPEEPEAPTAPASPEMPAGNPYARTSFAPEDDGGGKSLAGFMRSPYAALLSGGLNAMATGSLASGVSTGLKTFQGQETVEQAARKLDEEARQHQAQYTQMTPYQKALIEAKGEKSTAGLFDDATVDMMADQYLAGDKSIFANLGRGAQGPENIAKLRTAIAKKIAEQGGTGKDQAAAVANFGAQAAAAKTAAVRSANIDIAVEEARNTFPLALAASDSLPREQWVPWNRLAQAVRNNTSSPQQAKFFAANQAVITAYGQAMSRTGTNTVHAQESAEKLLSTVTSQESYRAVIAQLEQEMQAAKAAPDLVRKEILSRISGRHDAKTAAPAGAPKFTGRTASDKNGNKLRETADGQWVP